MLTKLLIRNFKCFAEAEIELGNPVVFIGPNNSGKTSALQALALWELGLRRWNEKRAGKETPGKRVGVAINRRDLNAVPAPHANLLWRDLHVRNVRKQNGKQTTDNIRIDIQVEGVSAGSAWVCGFEFDYSNEESFYCRPSRQGTEEAPSWMGVPDEASQVRVAFLPPMSGLADREFLKQPGETAFLIGQGRTAEVLRNLCYQVDGHDPQRWASLVERVHSVFGVRLDRPVYIAERSEIVMSYREGGTILDLSSAGRGVHQTLLLLAYLSANPGSVLLLDEPDAHLEILRQRNIYRLLTDVAREQQSQIIAASHSEVVMDEAAGKDVVVAFVGESHRIDDRGSQLLKALRDIGFEHFYQAEIKGWVLYLEGSTDLAILQSFAGILKHPAAAELERPFVHYVGNVPSKAREHFHGLREAKHDLAGFFLCDRIETQLSQTGHLVETMWKRREIENYLCQKETLLAYAEGAGIESVPGPLFASDWPRVMLECINRLVPQVAFDDPDDRWWSETKASDGFLDRLFEMFFSRLHLPNIMQKSSYHQLARFVPAHLLDSEVTEVLDSIAGVSRRAQPRT